MCISKMMFLGQVLQKLDHEQDGQTDIGYTQRDATERIATVAFAGGNETKDPTKQTVGLEI